MSSTDTAEVTAPPMSDRSAPRRRGADAYDTLLWRLLPRVEQAAGREEAGDADGAGLLVGVTACERRVGVSTVAANLAIRAADHRVRPVLLVEGASARPQFYRRFRLGSAPGLAEALAGKVPVSEAIHPTKVEGLEVMPLGAPGLLDRVGLDAQLVDATLRGLRESHELVVFDLPPADDLRGLLLVARRLDAAVLAVRTDATTRKEAARVAEQLRSDGVTLVGSVAARRRRHAPEWLRRRF